MTLKIVLLGNGNIARVLTDVVRSQRNYEVVAVVGRGGALPARETYDLLVEVASPEAVASTVLPAVQGGVHALVVSVGALGDEHLRRELQSAPGRAFAATGAIGGLEHIRALREAGALTVAGIESRKLPSTLIQSWMDDELILRLRRGRERIVLAEGSASHVASLFPRSANVAVAVALASDGWDFATATMIADPDAIDTVHVVCAEGDAGSCRFEMINLPSPQQPRSSAVVAFSVLRSIDTYAATGAGLSLSEPLMIPLL